MENKLNTIQKRGKLNEVFTSGDPGPGGAYHKYVVSLRLPLMPDHAREEVEISFQKGPRKEADSVQGVLDTDLLEIVRHRLQCFQEGDYRCRENACALTHLEEALMWMNRRVEDRIEREVLGTYER